MPDCIIITTSTSIPPTLSLKYYYYALFLYPFYPFPRSFRTSLPTHLLDNMKVSKLMHRDLPNFVTMTREGRKVGGQRKLLNVTFSSR